MASSAFCLCRATTLLIPYIFLAALAHPASLSSGTKPTRTFCFGRRTRTSSPTVTTGEVERFLGAVSDGAHSSLHRSYNASLHIDAQNRTMYAVAQCRPDVPASDCAACLAASSWFLAAGAASCADAAVWHEYGRCFFRYSDRDTSRFREDELAATVFNSSGRPARHGRAAVTGLLAAAMDRLDRRMQKRRLLGSTRAGDGVAWGWGAANSSAGQVYGAVQCAPGIARADCVRCLRGALAVAERDYNGSAGMQVLLLNCTARYESYRFYGKVSPDTDVITSAGPASPTADLAYATADPNYVLPSPAVIGIDITTPISPPPAAHGLPAGTNSTVPSTRPPAAPPEAALLRLPLISLAAAGSDADKPTLIFCSGVPPYFTSDKVNSLTSSTPSLPAPMEMVATSDVVDMSYNMSLYVARNRTMYGVAQCRPDIPISDCTACLKASLQFIADAVCAATAVWYDVCFLRYSDDDTSRFREEYTARVFNSSRVLC